MQKKMKKAIAIMVSAMMLITIMPMSVFAAGNEANEIQVDVEQVVNKSVTFDFTAPEYATYRLYAYDLYDDEYDDPDVDITYYDEEDDEYYDVDSDESSGAFDIIFNAVSGRRYRFEIYASDIEGPFKVKLVKLDVKSISFTPATPYTYEEFECGYYDDDDEIWYYDNPQYKTGDKLTVTMGDDTSADYVYNESLRAFTNESGNISRGSVSMTSNQYNNPWGVGKNNTTTVTYAGKSCTVPINIVASTIKSFEFVKKTPTTYKENDPEYSYKDEDRDEKTYSYYDVPYFASGDKILITKTDDTVVTYQFDDEDEWFVNTKDSSDYLDYEEVWRYSTQYSNHWTPDKDNYYLVCYRNFEFKVPVTIVAANQDKPVVKKANTIKVTPKTVTLKASKLKKKTQTVKASKAFTVKNAKGTVTYKLTKKDKKAKSKIKVAKNGKITVKKGLKKGKYTIKVKVTAAGTRAYKAKSKTLTVKIRVK